MENNVVIEEGAFVSDKAVILGNSVIKKGAVIDEFSKIIDSVIEEGVNVSFSVIERSHVFKDAKIGNFSYVHDSIIKSGTVIGHSVEIKNSVIGENTYIKHLSYVGDANVGNNVNIGACTVFANYDGTKKNKTEVEDNVFIGSGSILVAPLKIKHNSFIAAGSTITEDVNEYDLAIARNKQINKDKYLKG